MTERNSTNIEKSLELEIIDAPLLFRSKQLWTPIGARGVFGGQVIGLGLAAATKTVDSTFQVHSLHCYFLMAGDNSIQIIYKVDEIRTGRTYATRFVNATQRGRTIFTMMVSYAAPEISVLKWQESMPIVPRPDSLKSDVEELEGYLQNPSFSLFHSTIQMRLAQPIVIERKRVPSKLHPANPNKNKIMIWLKAFGQLPDDPAVHQVVAAYCSDFELLNAALVPFNLHRITEKRLETIRMMASLDHAIWFHETFRADQWLLYEIEAGKTGNGRGFANGRIWTEDGRLVISTAQEGIIRADVGENTAKL